MGSEPDDSTDLLDYLHSLPEHPTGFTLRKVTFEEVLKEINCLRSDSSAGYDQIPVKYNKLGKDHLAGPLMHMCIYVPSCLENSTHFADPEN